MDEFKVEELVPHAGDISLLDEVLAFDSESLQAKAIVRANNPFLDDGEVPSWLGIEYMAQAISAWAGTQAKQQGLPIELGFLVGTRKYAASTDHFSLHSELVVSIKRLMQSDNGLSVFECEINYAGGQASAEVKVFQPNDVDSFLQDG